MAQKNNIRSIRFSDELAELIDRQIGDTFTAKFENLVTRCVWELPAKEAELKRLEEEIQRKREKLKDLDALYCKLNDVYRDLNNKTTLIVQSMNQAINKISQDS